MLFLTLSMLAVSLRLSDALDWHRFDLSKVCPLANRLCVLVCVLMASTPPNFQVIAPQNRSKIARDSPKIATVIPMRIA